MSKHLGLAALLLGLIAVVWVGFGYIGSNPLALTMTALIGTFYLLGAIELHRFHQATLSLTSALAAVPRNLTHLADWLTRLHPSLRGPVRVRIEGERTGLPGPSMTPYLVGLLVLLGMLGTFLGMVITLHGAVMALESTTDLPTIRAALAAPVKGLGLAFGTSVAGVAASAMLGLVSALCRRERLNAAQDLDASIATTLRAFSLAHQRQATLESLQAQASVMPLALGKMQTLMEQMERQAEGMNERLLASQDRFHQQAHAAYTQLAASVEHSLRDSLVESARAAGATIQPVVEATMTGIARETASFQQKLADAAQVQLDGLATRFGTSVATVADVWTAALAQQVRTSEDLAHSLNQSLSHFSETFEQRSTSLLASVAARHAALVEGLVQQSASLLASMNQAHAAMRVEGATREQQRSTALTQSLESMAASLQREWQQAGAQAHSQQEQICKTLEETARGVHAQAEAHARSTIAEVSRLIDAASEAPRAAADVVALLRQKLSESMVRDNELLDERTRIVEALNTLLDAMNQGAVEQRGAIDALVASSAATLQQLGTQFTEKVDTESAKMSAVATQITSSAVEVSSLGEAFGLAVQLFSESSEALTTHLHRIEGALSKSTTRSDEQLAYYVAQAREIVDLSISAQQQIVDDLRQIAAQPAPLAGAVA